MHGLLLKAQLVYVVNYVRWYNLYFSEFFLELKCRTILNVTGKVDMLRKCNLTYKFNKNKDESIQIKHFTLLQEEWGPTFLETFGRG